MVRRDDINEDASKEVREANRLRDVVLDDNDPFQCGNFRDLFKRVFDIAEDAIELAENSSSGFKFPRELGNAFVVSHRRAKSAGCISEAEAGVIKAYADQFREHLEDGETQNAQIALNVMENMIDDGRIEFEHELAEASCKRSINSPNSAMQDLLDEHNNEHIGGMVVIEDQAETGPTTHYNVCAVLDRFAKE